MENTQHTHTPLWKQLVGAVVGGTLALGLYYGYEAAEPRVSAYLSLPHAENGRMFELGASNIADKTTDEGNRKRILSRNVRVAQQLEKNNDPAMLATVDTHELDVAWPGHNPNDPKYTEVTGLEPPAPVEPVEAEEDEWENLWDDIQEQEVQYNEVEEVEESNADDLPDTGLGLGLAAAGAAGAAFGMRKKKLETRN